MIIRNMTLSDKETFLSMSRDFYHSEATLHGFSRESQERNLDSFLAGSPFVRCLIFESEADRTVCGYSLIAHSWTTEYGGPMIILEELYFLPEFRNRGGSVRFFQWFFKEYDPKASGYRLEVAPANSYVMEIYRKHGFEPLEYLQMMKVLK